MSVSPWKTKNPHGDLGRQVDRVLRSGNQSNKHFILTMNIEFSKYLLAVMRYFLDHQSQLMHLYCFMDTSILSAYPTSYALYQLSSRRQDERDDMTHRGFIASCKCYCHCSNGHQSNGLLTHTGIMIIESGMKVRIRWKWGQDQEVRIRWIWGQDQVKMMVIFSSLVAFGFGKKW